MATSGGPWPGRTPLSRPNLGRVSRRGRCPATARGGFYRNGQPPTRFYLDEWWHVLDRCSPEVCRPPVGLSGGATTPGQAALNGANPSRRGGRSPFAPRRRAVSPRQPAAGNSGGASLGERSVAHRLAPLAVAVSATRSAAYAWAEPFHVTSARLSWKEVDVRGTARLSGLEVTAMSPSGQSGSSRIGRGLDIRPAPTTPRCRRP
jgi:hypothetical protein